MNSEQLIRLTTTITVLVAFLLVSSKLIVWYFTGSVSLLAATVDNFGDVCASLVAFFAARYAMKPANKKFRWGHSKAEPLSSLALGAFVSGAALVLIIESVAKIGLATHVVTMPWAVIGVMVFSIVLTGLLTLWQRHVVKLTDSSIIRADSMHYELDFLLNLVVILTMGLQGFWAGFDVIFGLAIAGYILWHTYREVINPSIKQLMDAELDSHDREKIVDIIKANPLVLGYHDLRTRRSGRDRFVQVHLDLDKTMPLELAHEVGDEIMFAIEKVFHRAEVIVHLDPVDADCVFKDGHRIAVNESGQKFNHHH